MPIAPLYRWLEREPGPRVVQKGLEIYGVKEVVGKHHNPIIIGWAHEAGLQKIYVADEIPWCGLVHYVLMQRAGKHVPFSAKDALWAQNWSKFGKPVKVAMLSDTLVFKREGGGHVGTYIGEDALCYHVLGGNQGNAFNISRIERSRCIAIRRLPYNVQPANIRVIKLHASGVPSTNEA